VSQYLERGDRFKAVELYRKANRATDAAQLLAGMAEEVGQRQANPLRAKKLQVLAALEVERFRKKVLDVTLQAMTNKGGTNIAQATAQTLDNLMTVDRESGKGKSKVSGAHAGTGYLLILNEHVLRPTHRCWTTRGAALRRTTTSCWRTVSCTGAAWRRP
jgi:hypothetical protein